MMAPVHPGGRRPGQLRPDHGRPAGVDQVRVGQPCRRDGGIPALRKARLRAHPSRHVPVIDEDDLPVDYLQSSERRSDWAISPVMIDGSRLDLAGNIAATRAAVELAHAAGIACEAELGAVLGHESGPHAALRGAVRIGQGLHRRGRRATVRAPNRLRLALGRPIGQRPRRDLRGDERPEEGGGPAGPRSPRTAGRGYRHPSRAATAAPASSRSTWPAQLARGIARSISPPKSARPTRARCARSAASPPRSKSSTTAPVG